MYDLQSRWKLDGCVLRYYGLRNVPDMLCNTVRLTKKQIKIVKKLPAELTYAELAELCGLVGVQIVRSEHKRVVPRSLGEARFCKTCIANDFIIPGIEFDEKGRCPICQSDEITQKLKSILPVMNEFPRAKRSRFDVALFYTGGKDSTYLLYYLSFCFCD